MSQESVILDNKMYDLITELKQKGLKIVVFSNMGQFNAEIAKKNGYFDLFDDVILAHEIGYEKPNPKAYDILLSKLNVSPSQCIFIDDDEENIAVAKEKGINGIVFKSSDLLKNDLNKILDNTMKHSFFEKL